VAEGKGKNCSCDSQQVPRHEILRQK